MGHEQRMADAMKRAELERMVGDIKDFKHYDETGCPKCQTPKEGFVRRWCQGRNALAPPRPVNSSEAGCLFNVVGEHLHVMCQGCHYGWLERTADNAPIPVEPTKAPLVEA